MIDRLTPIETVADVEIVHQPSYTYSIDYATDSQIRGFTDELKAMEQAIYKIINTERYEYIIYSWNYGIELADLFGQPIPYVYAELQRRIEEALLADDRVTNVYGFTFDHNGGDVYTSFNVDTIYGQIRDVRKELMNIV